MDIGHMIMYTTCYFGLFTAILFFLTFFEDKKNLKNPKSTRLPSITVAIPALNEEKTVSATIKSLLALDYPKKKVEIMVIDDGSTDNTYKIAKTFEKFGVKVFKKKNTGKGDTLNYALKRAKGELFAALDADSFVDSDCLMKMVGYFKNNKVMAVTPSLKIHEPKGILQRIQHIEFLLGIYLRKVFALMGSIHVTPGPFTVYRKEFFDKHGGYDDDNLTEDIEVALRIQSHQYIIENSIDASVRTVGPHKFAPLRVQRERWYVGFMNNVGNYKHLFSKKYGNLGMFILPAAFVSVGLLIVLLFYTLFKTGESIYTRAINLYAINFDIWPLLKFKFDAFFFNLEPLVLISMLSLMTGIVVISIAKKYSEEKEGIKLSYVFFLFIYSLIFAYWWVIAGVSKVRGKKIKWGVKHLR